MGISKIVPRSKVQALVRAHEAKGQSVVLTNGCFDLLHIGHVRYLRAAKELGTKLVVAMDSDASVRRIKGKGRPILPERSRAEMLAELQCVDYVFIFDEPFVQVLSELKPRVYAKGGDYVLDPSQAKDGKRPIVQDERRVVEGYGGRIHILDVGEQESTSLLLERIIDRLGE